MLRHIDGEPTTQTSEHKTGFARFADAIHSRAGRIGVGMVLVPAGAVAFASCGTDTGLTPSQPEQTAISSTQNGGTTGNGDKTGTSGDHNTTGEKLKIAGKWECKFDSTPNTILGSFMVEDDGDGGWQVISPGANGTFTLPLVITDSNIAWYGDKSSNDAGWDVKLNLNNGGLNGASGTYLNHFDNTTWKITGCKPY